jgi:hypothetical protein
MNILSLVFSTSFCNGWPKIKVYLDEDLYQDHEFSKDNEIVDIPLDLLDGLHTLKIELYNKSNRNTKVVDNIIVQDQLVTLENIKVDGVTIPEQFLYEGRYTYNNVEPYRGLTWGINGHWSWNFQTPIINWIITQKNLNQGVSTDSIISQNYSEGKHQRILEHLDILETKLNGIRI